MWPDRVSNPGPLTYESGVLPIALRGPINNWCKVNFGDKGKGQNRIELQKSLSCIKGICCKSIYCSAK